MNGATESIHTLSRYVLQSRFLLVEFLAPAGTARNWRRRIDAGVRRLGDFLYEDDKNDDGPVSPVQY